MGIGALRRHRRNEDEEQEAEQEETPQPEPEPAEEQATGEIEVEQSGSWYTIYRDGEQVEKVQGQDALDEALDELEG